MQNVAVALLVVAMMLAVGLQVPMASLARVLRERRWLARTLTVNVVLVPALAVALTSLVPVSPAVAAALVLCATAPGGPLGPVLAGLAGADLPLATAVMIVLALVSVVSTPLLASAALAASDAGRLGVWPLFSTVLVYQILPLAGGMAIRQRFPQVAGRLAPAAARAANGMLAVVIVGLVVTRADVLVAMAPSSFVTMVLFVVACLLAGAALGGGPRRSRALSLCTGVRNLALALLVAAAHLRDPEIDAALLSFGFVMLACPAVVALWWRRRAADEAWMRGDGPEPANGHGVS